MTQTISAPVIRALLLTDLCDSVSLVERIGDVASAELFRSHDLLVLELQQRWSGRLIDRSDGMLLVFERPLHAIGFALDYMAGLDGLGRDRKLTLKARAGLHVGEVLLWENSQQAIDAGAKPLEVEGLAKPMAARLMGLARPGQVLVSAVAEALARRASKEELGSLGERLVWKSHGRWQFKGVPKPQEVYEVGETGKAPLRQPLAGAKAQPVRPLWRRPLAVALQLVAVAGGLSGLWYATRSESAIAFSQRDWVVLADVENIATDDGLNLSLEQGLRIALEQSQYLNVVSSEQVAGALELLGHERETRLSRELAGDVAQREGARLVVLPSLEKRDQKWRLSLDLIDPLSGRTVRNGHVQVVAETSEQLLEAVDQGVRSMRAQLGEAPRNISSSEPLPQVSTSSLPALRAYALAEKAIGQRDYVTATELYSAALEADPEFALARVGQARLMWRMRDLGQARAHLEQALHRRDALPLRERLYLDAWSEELSLRGWATERWEALARLYPDFAAGPSNASWYLLMDNRFGQSESYARQAGYSRHPMRAFPLVHLARAHLAQGQYDQALQVLDEVEGLLGTGRQHDLRGDVLAARGDFSQAAALFQATSTGNDTGARSMGLRGLIILAAARNDCSQMQQSARNFSNSLKGAPGALPLHGEVMMQLVKLCDARQPLPAGPMQDLTARFEAQISEEMKQEQLGINDLHQRLLSLAYVAQRGSQPGIADGIVQRHSAKMMEIGNPVTVKLLGVVLARQQLDQGHPENVIERLRAQLDGTELYQARVVLRDAYQRMGNLREADEQSRWLARNGGRAWAEVVISQQLQPINVLDLMASQPG
ncbi:hypothetical protein ABB30_06210 [Stenotrophomonas ginsengisoli]|uniref:Ancillary SecYEG translocon subunit/Cell division coordinator CpoB TPR domain-containing protein n=1 Tax=Stenotrophomonas ginsengisoli TaxID=336566 RepID=A0A0R0D8H9_9GAMM|nr:putative peptide modification system cyclase [Stenotrophomonas ginsengisoli]KRG77990.1 hypothetical protein ABB30_06210 [Stenotrophomonas ginsengisoli]